MADRLHSMDPMQYRVTFFAAALAVAACDPTGSRVPNDPGGGDDDGSTSVDAGVPGASPPVPSYAGEQFRLYSGSGSYERNRAEVTWTLASTDGCVDHYAPSGTVFDEDAGPCNITLDPPSGAIEAGDGALVIDRTASPATYTVHGSSTFDTIYTGDPSCDDTPEPTPGIAGGEWAASSGSFDGALIAGVAYTDSPTRSWYLVAAGAAFPPPDVCSEPASDQWTSQHAIDSSSATVTWTRISTDGCVDVYEPSGTAIGSPGIGGEGCTFPSYAAPIEPDDGPMTIDRSTNPPTVKVRGLSIWTVVVDCVNNQGEPYTSEQSLVSRWGDELDAVGMPFDGDRWSGTYELAFGDAIAWSFARGE